MPSAALGLVWEINIPFTSYPEGREGVGGKAVKKRRKHFKLKLCHETQNVLLIEINHYFDIWTSLQLNPTAFQNVDNQRHRYTLRGVGKLINSKGPQNSGCCLLPLGPSRWKRKPSASPQAIGIGYHFQAQIHVNSIALIGGKQVSFQRKMPSSGNRKRPFEIMSRSLPSTWCMSESPKMSCVQQMPVFQVLFMVG